MVSGLDLPGHFFDRPGPFVDHVNKMNSLCCVRQIHDEDPEASLRFY